MDKKKKLFSLPGKNGNVDVVFLPVELSGQKTVCEQHCVYRDICDKLKDPRDPDNDKSNFMEFCNSIPLEEKDGGIVCQYVPAPGSIENIQGAEDLFQQLIKANPIIKVNEFIDTVCPTWCDSYNEFHSNCTSCNEMCILKNLFLKKGIDGTRIEEENQVEKGA